MSQTQPGAFIWVQSDYFSSWQNETKDVADLVQGLPWKYMKTLNDEPQVQQHVTGQSANGGPLPKSGENGLLVMLQTSQT